MALKTFIEAIRETLADEMRRDPSVIVLGEEIGRASCRERVYVLV